MLDRQAPAPAAVTHSGIRGGGASPLGGRLPNLDALRVLAITAVIAAHASIQFPPQVQQITDRLIPFGAGVRIFFCVSGFLTTHLFLREVAKKGSIDIKGFYKRRALRLLPVIGVFLLFTLLVTQVSQAQETALGWLTSLTFTKNLHASTWLTGHLWSMATQEQFYLFWPALVGSWVAKRHWLCLCVTLIASASLSRLALYWLGREGFASVSLFTNVDALACGATAAIGMHKSPRLTAWLARHAAFAALAGLALALVGQQLRSAVGSTVVLQSPWWLAVRALSPVPMLLGVTLTIAALVLMREGRVPRVLNSAPVLYLGQLSYSLYIWQQAFLIKPGYYGEDLPVTAFPLNVICALATAVLSLELIEKPIQRLRGRLSHAPMVSPASP